jgi:hypothetical protein
MRKTIVMIALLLSGFAQAQNIGIGTNDPQQRLDVAGTSYFRDSIGIGEKNPHAHLQFRSIVGNRKIVLFEQSNNDHQFDGFGTAFDATRYQVSNVNVDHVFLAGVTSTTSNELFRIKGSGRIGIGVANPISLLANTNTNTIGSDGVGINDRSITWAMNDKGYVETLYNLYTAFGGNGLAVKIAGTTAGNSLLDLSTGATQTGTGTTVMSVRGNGRVGIATAAPVSKLANTSTNIVGSDGIGINGNSLSWSLNNQGYVEALYNQTTGFGANGLAVKIAGTTSSARIMDLSSGVTQNTTGTTVMAVNGNGSVEINGSLSVSGLLSKGGGSFKIDHPLDPANKYLYHSFVESPDMMNIYNGNITTGNDGLIIVTLPDYFEALNKDFRYQLTVIGDFAQAIIFKKINNNRFTIKTDKPNIEVSWQVTGIRHDPFAEKNRIPNAVDKPANEKGYYLHPEALGLPAALSVSAIPVKKKENTEGNK